MARPEKRGLDYFPLDVDFMRDRKVRRINRKHGALGIVVIIQLYSLIYHENGYYLPWDEDSCFDICEELNAETPEQIQVIVDSCLEVGLFHAGLYETQHVLTSNGVQCRYKACCARRSSARILPELNLIECPQEEKEAKPTEEVVQAPEKSVEVFVTSTSTEVESVKTPELSPTETELMYTETELVSTEMPQTKQKESKEKRNKPPPNPLRKRRGPRENGVGVVERLFFSSRLCLRREHTQLRRPVGGDLRHWSVLPKRILHRWITPDSTRQTELEDILRILMIHIDQ